MTEHHKDTEQLILSAARKVFIEKGLDGARMQEIADEAGINKALLHYYFRSKEKLFSMIFQEEMSKFFPRMVMLLSSADISIEEKIRGFVNNYISIFLTNPFLPSFILRELNRDPDNLKDYFIKSGFETNNIKLIYTSLSKQLNMSIIDTKHFMINMVSLCIFPFAGRPLIEKIIFFEDNTGYDKFLEGRKEVVANYMIKYLNNR